MKWIDQQRLNKAFLRAHRADALTAQGGVCKYCAVPLRRVEATTEHRHPKKLGGTNARENIAASCSACNSAKAHMPEKAFQKAIRNPLPVHHWSIHIAALRRTIWKRTHLACWRIAGAAGIHYQTPRRQRP